MRFKYVVIAITDRGDVSTLAKYFSEDDRDTALRLKDGFNANNIDRKAVVIEY